MLSRALAGITLAAMVPLAGAGGRAAPSAQGIGQQVRAAEQPQLRAVGLPKAWRASRGRGVTVGVLDTGVDPAAPDLTGSVTTGPDYTRGANPAGYQPPHLHGTYIASLIAGHGSGPGRTGGVIGVAPAARILSVRVILDDQEPGFAVYNENASYANAIAKGIRYAVRHGVSVINMSLGSGFETRQMRLAIGYAISDGVVVVASAGNSGSGRRGYTPYSYPASFPGVISVAAVRADGKRASFSDRNSSVVVSAPGVNVVGAIAGGQYVRASGTSPASAFVAGVAALIRSRYPRLTPPLVTQAIIASVTHRPARGYSPSVGFGEVNAAVAVVAAARLAAARPAAGLAASGYFGTGAHGRPVQVVHRNRAVIDALAAVAIAALLGILLALILLARVLRRGRKGTRPAGRPPPGPVAGFETQN